MKIKPQRYDEEGRRKRAEKYVQELSTLLDLRGKRVLEIGPHLGDLSVMLASELGCEVVGIDPRSHPNWPELQQNHPSITMHEGSIAEPPEALEDNSFDLIISFVVWEHIRNPWSALKSCQRLLKPTGKKFLRANLYRSAIASHLYNTLDDPWPHLIYSPNELKARMKIDDLSWAFWVNKLTYQQYLFYFRQLGFFITHEKLYQAHFSQEYYDGKEQQLGLYPQWDLSTDFFEVVLEFDQKHPKQGVDDPVYRLGG